MIRLFVVSSMESTQESATTAESPQDEPPLEEKASGQTTELQRLSTEDLEAELMRRKQTDSKATKPDSSHS